jgi:hypothetical protein
MLCTGGASQYVVPVHVLRLFAQPAGVRDLWASAQRRIKRREHSIADETLEVFGGG